MPEVPRREALEILTVVDLEQLVSKGRLADYQTQGILEMPPLGIDVSFLPV
jgi:hypothetical protein